MNILGDVFMNIPLRSPYNEIEKILQENDGKYDLAIMDLHAEATSEKIVLANAFSEKNWNYFRNSYAYLNSRWKNIK